ncbi:MAG: filamentous hemagglutinin N-terminal domain-containing protein [Gammaproteobacteria bacterium]|nr:filamentous hemagglutinin N-terminal domain-containing protein [Gammaproteobacteria bacterium]
MKKINKIFLFAAKKSRPRIYNRCMSLLGFSVCIALTSFSLPGVAAPTGGAVVGGQGSINYQGQNTNINQASQRMAINWQTFNVQTNESVNFVQPNSSAVALNRILDQNPSQILGSINANGQVMLVNPHGVIFSETATVNVGGLLASGLDINPQSFMNGNLLFSAMDNTDGVVINRGLLNAATGGSISLLGKSVQNECLISANMGKVNLASGSEAVVTFDSAGLIGIEVTQEVLENSLGVDSIGAMDVSRSEENVLPGLRVET